MDYYPYIKALHIIFITTWFAGLFYIVRLFIYFKESEEKPKNVSDILIPQYKLMIKRLWLIITWPSAILATIFAIWMLILMPSYLQMGWMKLKLIFVAFLFIYHFICHKMYKQTQEGKLKMSSIGLRIWNEVATIILFACVFLVVLKDSFSWVYGVVGILAISILLMLGLKWYKSLRKKNNWEDTSK